MIPKRIALLLAPWCLVLFIAIGCSRTEPPEQGATGTDPRQPVTAISIAERGEQLPPLERYAEISKTATDAAARARALDDFYRRWGAEDGEAAVAHAMAQNVSLISSAFAGWLEADGRAPRDWVLAYPGSSRLQGRLATGLLRALPADDHAERAGWVEHFTEGKAGAALVSEVAIGWGGAKPEQALDWLTDLPEGKARAGGIEMMFQRWSRMDPEFASTHLTRMEAGSAKDLAISSLAKAIHESDPEAARLWASSISDSSLREVTAGFLDQLAARHGGAPIPQL